MTGAYRDSEESTAHRVSELRVELESARDKLSQLDAEYRDLARARWRARWEPLLRIWNFAFGWMFVRRPRSTPPVDARSVSKSSREPATPEIEERLGEELEQVRERIEAREVQIAGARALEQARRRDNQRHRGVVRDDAPHERAPGEPRPMGWWGSDVFYVLLMIGVLALMLWKWLHPDAT